MHAPKGKRSSAPQIHRLGYSLHCFAMPKVLSILLIPPLLVLLGLQETTVAMVQTWSLEIFGAELAHGFRHILPEGLDHMAFIAGLFFLSRSLPALIAQTTLFTLAHSAALGTVIFLGMSLPSRWVEIGVGLSIALLAVEGACCTRMKPWRPLMIGLFGAVHGMAFAHSLVQEQNLRRSPLAALFGFNLGVEAGQLVVIFALALAFCPWWQRTWYRPRIASPALGLIAISGVHWAWENALRR